MIDDHGRPANDDTFRQLDLFAGVAFGELHQVPGFTGVYATADGRVFSYDRTGRLTERPPTAGGSTDYLACTISVGGKSKWLAIHRAVWSAFNGPIADGVVIMHLDNDKRNPRLSNLRAGTQSENMRDHHRHGAPRTVPKQRTRNAPTSAVPTHPFDGGD